MMAIFSAQHGCAREKKFWFWGNGVNAPNPLSEKSDVYC